MKKRTTYAVKLLPAVQKEIPKLAKTLSLKRCELVEFSVDRLRQDVKSKPKSVDEDAQAFKLAGEES